MPDEARLIGAFLGALVAAGCATPLAISVATRTGFQDQPQGYKGHARPTPYLGGAAVISAFILAALVLAGTSGRVLTIVLCAVALWGVGTVDDKSTLTPAVRVGAEILAAVALWQAGIGWELFESDVANLATTAFWVVALVNAFNLMDNMDGAATSVAAVTSACTGVLALLADDTAIAALSFGLAGACMGFLPYNLAGPAKIFLGDGGSIPIGFTVAASLMALSHAGDWHLVVSASMLAGLPLVDTSLVVISRRRRGLSFLTAGRDHLTHRLRTRFGSARAVALVLAAMQGLLGVAAVATSESGRSAVLVAGLVCFVLAGLLIATVERPTWTEGFAVDEPGTASPPRRQPPLTAIETAAVTLIAVACGLSPFFYGFYEVSVWGPITLVLLAILLGLLIARPAALERRALLAVAGLGGLWLWGLISVLWAESADQAMVSANRWLFFTALFSVLVLLLRRDSVARVVMVAATGVVLVFVGYLTAKMLAGEGAGLFLGNRLNEPLGYINGQAGYLMLGLWPLMAAAELARRPVYAGAAIGAAILLASIALLSQTRAVVPAVVVSAVVLLVFVPGRIRRLWGLAFVALALAAVAGELIDATEASATGVADSDALESAVRSALVAALIGGLAWGFACWAAERLVQRSQTASRTLARASAVVLAIVAAGGAVALIPADPVSRVGDEARAFVDLKEQQAGTSRFTSAGGNRYDYWRIAWLQFRDRPVGGVGAGNFDTTYFAERKSTENVRQAHSIELQALGELGIVGLALLLLFLVPVLAGFGRHAARARTGAASAWIAIAAGGMFLTWLVHTSVDWLHLIPGVSGIALCAMAVLVSPWRAPRSSGGRVRSLAVGAGVVLVVLGATFVTRSVLADRYVSEGQDQLASDPGGALSDAQAALEVDDEVMKAYYLEAAAYARLGQYEDAQASLREATGREPHDFIPWALLGDLATRRAEADAAQRFYARAHELNPRDEALEALAEQGAPPAP